MTYSKHEHLGKKICEPVPNPALVRMINYWRFHGKRVVFTNGCFDIVHAGHVDYLARAADLGDVLVVGLNTDASVQRIKGPARPVNPQDARAKVLSALRFVDAVVLFDEDTPEALVRQIVPDVLVKGADYDAGEIAGADTVREQGGQVVTLPLVEGFSTSALLAKIRSGDDDVI